MSRIVEKGADLQSNGRYDWQHWSMNFFSPRYQQSLSHSHSVFLTLTKFRQTKGDPSAFHDTHLAVRLRHWKSTGKRLTAARCSSDSKIRLKTLSISSTIGLEQLLFTQARWNTHLTFSLHLRMPLTRFCSSTMASFSFLVENFSPHDCSLLNCVYCQSVSTNKTFFQKHVGHMT